MQNGQFLNIEWKFWCLLHIDTWSIWGYRILVEYANHEHGKVIDDPVPTHTIFTGASLSIWGVYFGDIRIIENWTNDDLHIADSNINILELSSIKHAIIKCLSSISSSTVLLRSDIGCELYQKNGWKHPQDNNFFWHVHIWLVVKTGKLILWVGCQMQKLQNGHWTITMLI